MGDGVEKVEYIGRLQNDRLLKDKKQIVIFGAGKGLDWLLEQLQKLGVKDKVFCICDNNPKEQGRRIEGIEIVSPAYAFSSCNKGSYLVYNRFWREICGQLKEEGIEKIHLIRG